ncbi:MAG: hypothetical protein DI537_10340 [Stutzerimonas stutzeri]|nr:MAG: hypothetical protein DI537_10340 [Stutzerimonas stutzeri]
MPRYIRLAVQTDRTETVIDLASQHSCNQHVIRSVFRSPNFDIIYDKDVEDTIDLSPQTLVNRLRNFELSASILDIRDDAALRSALIQFRDVILADARDSSLRIRLSVGPSIGCSVDEEAMRIDPDRYLTPLRQQELVGLADAGQGASAVRLAIRETAAAFSRQLHLH